MSRFSGALPGALLATVVGVVTGTPLSLFSSQFHAASLFRVSICLLVIDTLSGIYTFRPAFQEQADKKSFDILHQKEKVDADLGPDMNEVVPKGRMERYTRLERPGSMSALALLEAGKNASRPPSE